MNKRLNGRTVVPSGSGGVGGPIALGQAGEEHFRLVGFENGEDRSQDGSFDPGQAPDRLLRGRGSRWFATGRCRRLRPKPGPVFSRFGHRDGRGTPGRCAPSSEDRRPTRPMRRVTGCPSCRASAPRKTPARRDREPGDAGRGLRGLPANAARRCCRGSKPDARGRPGRDVLVLPVDRGPLVGGELGLGSSEHLGRTVDSEDPGVGPAPGRDRGEMSWSAAEVDDDLRIGMSDPGHQLESGPAAQVGKGQVGLGVPEGSVRSARSSSDVIVGRRGSPAPSRSTSAEGSGSAIRQIQLPSSRPGGVHPGLAAETEKVLYRHHRHLGGGLEDRFDQVPVDLVLLWFRSGASRRRRLRSRRRRSWR